MPAQSGLPFDDIRALVAGMPGPDEAAAARTAAREAELVKPAGSLGRLEEITGWLARWQAGGPKLRNPVIALFAANHGVAARGVSAYPASVTETMVEVYAAGGAAINQLALAFNAGLKVFDLALDHPTPDITQEAALGERECAATMAFGMEALAGEPDLLLLGEMGIGNTTVAAALAAALFGGVPAQWVGRGTGIDDAGLVRKEQVVAEALAHHGGALKDPLEALRRVGGREFAALAGAILAARHQRVPVLIDGYAVTAAAAVLWRLDARALDHCLFAHVSAEPGHRRLLEAMGKRPLLDLDMRLGEGSGAGVALGLVRAALATHTGMATFAQAGIAR